jgi:hypothetical protein
MRAKTISVAVFIMLSLLGTATLSGQRLSLGAHAGAGISYSSNLYAAKDLSGVDDISRYPDVMATGGFIMNYRFNKWLGLRADLLFQQKGERYEFDMMQYDGPKHYELEIYVNFITLPVLVQASHSFGKFILTGGTGLFIAYSLNGKLLMIKPEKTEVNIEFGKDQFTRFDIGLSFDLGFGYSLGPGNLFMDLRYDLGLLDVYHLSDKPEDYKPAYTRNAGITLGYLIPLGEK